MASGTPAGRPSSSSLVDSRETGPTLPLGDAVQLVILDCDGVLFDSRDANVAFYDSILAARPVAPRRSGRELCHRLSGPQLWAHLFAADPSLHKRAKEAAAKADYSPFYPLMRPSRHSMRPLQRLSAHCPLALATNRGSYRRGRHEAFALERFFSIWVGILDVPRPKPAPDLLLACLERSGVAAEASVFVGDTRWIAMLRRPQPFPMSESAPTAVPSVRSVISELPDSSDPDATGRSSR